MKEFENLNIQPVEPNCAEIKSIMNRWRKFERMAAKIAFDAAWYWHGLDRTVDEMVEVAGNRWEVHDQISDTANATERLAHEYWLKADRREGGNF